jgi:hypothetical protein
VNIVEDGKAGGPLPPEVIEVKKRFDPLGLLNPGKLRDWPVKAVDDGWRRCWWRGSSAARTRAPHAADLQVLVDGHRVAEPADVADVDEDGGRRRRVGEAGASSSPNRSS